MSSSHDGLRAVRVQDHGSSQDDGLVPQAYAQAAVLAEQVGTEILARFAWLADTLPTDALQVVVDICARTGQLSQCVRQRYPQLTVLTMDQSLEMLRYAALPCSICTDATALALRDHSVDAVIAHFTLPWCQAQAVLAALQEYRRVLHPQGILLLSTVGTQTMQEWTGVFDNAELPTRLAIDQLGELLLQAGFKQPVIDTDYYAIQYTQKAQLGLELYRSGWWRLSSEADVLQRLVQIADQAIFAVTYEVLYVTAFAAQLTHDSGVTMSTQDIVRVPARSLLTK